MLVSQKIDNMNITKVQKDTSNQAAIPVLQHYPITRSAK